jgi:hypothetical protein
MIFFCDCGSRQRGHLCLLLNAQTPAPPWVPNGTRHPSLFGRHAAYATNSYEVNSGIGLAGATHHAYLTG